MVGTPIVHPDTTLRAARVYDAPSLAVLASQVWLHTYATEGITDAIAQYVLSALTPARFETLLADSAVDLIVAEAGAALLGFASVRHRTPCPDRADVSAELQTLYVQEHGQGQGIGTALLQAAQAQARKRSKSRLWLSVNAHNTRAMDFYAREGFERVGTINFLLGEQGHENHVLVERGPMSLDSASPHDAGRLLHHR